MKERLIDIAIGVIFSGATIWFLFWCNKEFGCLN